MNFRIDHNTIEKFDVPGPRYTSYPTAPNWDESVDEAVYAEKLKDFGRTDKTLSVYTHIPFCRSMCTFCGCNVLIRRHEPKYADRYIDYLEKELRLLRNYIGRRAAVRQFHWGGGTPNFLTLDQTRKLFEISSDVFDIDREGEIAVEIDPRTVSVEQLDLYRQLGFNRISMGVQDFDEIVQKDINRIQPFEQVRDVFAHCRRLGFKSVNLDLIYGLPHQNAEEFTETARKVVDLKPDRIALYSFAYVPWLKHHQRKIDKATLPAQEAKLDIFVEARNVFLNSGYLAIAMDHFALETDELAESFRNNRLYRNFMGYTVKPADEFLGAGLTSIGYLEDTFIQNTKIIGDYYKALDEGRLPVERGKHLSRDDMIRRWVIHSLMCRFEIDMREFFRQFGIAFDEYFASETGHIQYCLDEGLIRLERNRIRVTDLGKIFVRNVCMGFDAYLQENKKSVQFSRTV